MAIKYTNGAIKDITVTYVCPETGATITKANCQDDFGSETDKYNQVTIVIDIQCICGKDHYITLRDID